MNIKNKRKIQLQQEMENLQKRINNVPCILLSSPEISLQSINLKSYEIFPTEPLHDLRGHARNLIDEATKLAKGENFKVLKKIESTEQKHIAMLRLSQGSNLHLQFLVLITVLLNYA